MSESTSDPRASNINADKRHKDLLAGPIKRDANALQEAYVTLRLAVQFS